MDNQKRTIRKVRMNVFRDQCAIAAMSEGNWVQRRNKEAAK